MLPQKEIHMETYLCSTINHPVRIINFMVSNTGIQNTLVLLSLLFLSNTICINLVYLNIHLYSIYKLMG